MFNEVFEKLKNMKGCLAIEFTDNTGEAIFLYEHKKDFGIREISKSSNDVLQGMHEVSNRLNLGSISSIQVDSDDLILFSFCTGEMNRIHLHLFVVFDSKSNIALSKLAINEAIKEALLIINT